mgnify:CR=1 FL=1
MTRGVGGNDVTDATIGEQVKEIGINGMSGKRAQREWRDESCCGWREQCLHVCARSA